VVYEMLTGTLPFDGPSPDVVIKHLHAMPEPPSARKFDLPFAGEVDALVMRMLAKTTQQRFTDAYHLADELRGLLDQLQGGRGSKPPRRSGVLSSLPGPESHVTLPWVDAAEETWALRYELFTSLMPRAYPSGDVPEPVRKALRDMSDLIEQTRHIRGRLSDNLLQAKEHEDNLRAARLRVGHAADELGQDESRIVRRMAEAQAAIEGVRTRLLDCEQPLRDGLAELATLQARGGMTRPLAELLRHLGGSAAIWLETDTQLAGVGARVVAAEREREDLRFQIAQLKGRLGILNAEADAELNALREQAETLEGELSHAVEQLARTADPITRALAQDPSLRDALANVRQGSGPRAASSSRS
jgi:serine/threonine-protein kinase